VKTLIIGAGGMIGRKLAAQLPNQELMLQDIVPFDGASVVSDLSAPGEAEKLVASRPQLIFHLAAVVSGEAEADFDKGYRVNLDATRRLFEAIRKEDYKPRVVFTSSIAARPSPKRSATSS
jgi:D-erythronate 2-dehydrogenase